MLVAFSDKRILTYIWDSNAPKGTMQSASNIPLVHIYAVVCQSGAAEANNGSRRAATSPPITNAPTASPRRA